MIVKCDFCGKPITRKVNEKFKRHFCGGRCYGDFQNARFEARKKSPEFICKRDLYAAAHRILKSANIGKNARAFQYIGCSPGFLRNHLESLFQPGMTWENREEWEIDYIVPLSWWDLKNHPENLFIASHWTNLQPVWKDYNRKKKALFSG